MLRSKESRLSLIPLLGAAGSLFGDLTLELLFLVETFFNLYF